MQYALCGSKRQHNWSRQQYHLRSNPKATITKSNNTQLAPQYIYTAAQICNSWHMSNCKELFKLQIRPPSLIVLIAVSQDRWMFRSQSWEVKNSVIIIMIKIIIIIIIIKKPFKLQIRPPSLIVLIAASQDRWIFPSQSWEVKNSVIIIIIII